MTDSLRPRPLGTTAFDILPLDAYRCRVYRQTIIFSKGPTTYLMTMPTGAVWAVEAPIAHDDIALDHALTLMTPVGSHE